MKNINFYSRSFSSVFSLYFSYSTDTIVVTADATHRPVKCFLLHAGIADYFHHGGQRFQNLSLQPTKRIKLLVSL